MQEERELVTGGRGERELVTGARGERESWWLVLEERERAGDWW